MIKSLWYVPPLADLHLTQIDIGLLNKTIYGIRRYPNHWYNMIKGIIIKIGLNTSPHDPCLLYITPTQPPSPTDSQHSISQLHIELYVDDLLFYSSNTLKEELFKILPQYHIKVDFVGNFAYFSGKYFIWLTHKDRNILVHLSQSAFTELTAHLLSVHTFHKEPNMTSYCSGYPIESIHPVDPLYPDFIRQK